MKILAQEAIVEAYREIGNIKKTAKHLKISQHVVSAVLHEAGAVKVKNQPNSSKSICFDCNNAFANKCAFMRADIDEAESVLQKMGARYKSKIYTYRYMRGTRDVTLLTVLDCPRHQPGSVTG